MLRRIAMWLALWAFCLPVKAASLEWPERPYSHYSNHEPLRDFLRTMAAGHSIAIVVSEKIEETISASFTDLLPGEIFRQLVNAYQLIWYFDGNTLYVYRSEETKAMILMLNHITPQQLHASLVSLDISDNRFPWNTDEQRRMVYLSGPPRFVELIETMTNQLDRPANTRAKTVYRWYDANGVVHFSSMPPSTSADYTIVHESSSNRPWRQETAIANEPTQVQ